MLEGKSTRLFFQLILDSRKNEFLPQSAVVFVVYHTNYEHCRKLIKRSREIAEEKFDVDKVNAFLLSIIE